MGRKHTSTLSSASSLSLVSSGIYKKKNKVTLIVRLEKTRKRAGVNYMIMKHILNELKPQILFLNLDIDVSNKCSRYKIQ